MTELSPLHIPVCFVSDLHLFSRRTRGHLIDADIVAAARRSRVCVLGGDIFDFKWSSHSSHEASLTAAVEWLCRLIEAVPECQFHFVLGNHDDLPALVALLPELATRYANFFWDRFYLRLGDTVFLHGDAADRKMSHDRLSDRRDRFSHAPRQRWAHGLYGLVVHSQMHRLIPHAVYPPLFVADRLLKYLREVHQGPEEGVRQVCFGHTHRPMAGYSRGGVVFHNGGAPIGRAYYRIVEIQVTTQSPWDNASPE